MDKAQDVLKLFCHASRAKINCHKSVAIWASKKEKTWNWGRDDDLRWVPEGEGTQYLGIQVGFHLPFEVNFDKMMLALKGKLINWSHNKLSLASRILVANQVLLALMWYLATCWNPNPRICYQVSGVVKKFIWGDKDVTKSSGTRWHSQPPKVAWASSTPSHSPKPYWLNSWSEALLPTASLGRSW